MPNAFPGKSCNEQKSKTKTRDASERGTKTKEWRARAADALAATRRPRRDFARKVGICQGFEGAR